METPVPATSPQLVAPETWLIPNLVPAGDGLFLSVNSMVIRGAEPVIVDTGAPVHEELWREKVFSLVEPGDVRWIFLSHDDGDHTGGLLDALARCPNATLVTNFFSVERLALEKPPLLPLDDPLLLPGIKVGRRDFMGFFAGFVRLRRHHRPLRAGDGPGD